MADYFCDHGAYGASNRLGIDTPTWGIPQEGDGTSTSPSGSASTAAIQFNSQPTAGQTVQICGIAFTAVASGATGNQFNIGASVDVTAQNLANTINNSTTTVSTSIASGSPQIRNLMFARGPSGGAPSATTQIMMRVGSASLNSGVGNQIVATLTSPTITQWNGGVGGCLGYLINEVAIGAASTYSAYSYGIITGVLAHIAGTTTINDSIYVRTGNNTTINGSISSTTSSSRSSASYLVKLIFDTNTKWTSDPADGTLTLAITCNTSNFTFNLSSITVPYLIWQCLRRGNFVIKQSTTNSIGVLGMSVSTAGGYTLIDGVKFVDSNASGVLTMDMFRLSSSTSIANLLYQNCDYERLAAQATIPSMNFPPTSFAGKIRLDGCVFHYNISGTSDPGPLFNINNTPGAVGLPNQYVAANCVFIADGYSGGLTPFASGQPSWATNTSQYYLEYRFENCIGLKYPNSFVGLFTTATRNDLDSQMLYMNLGANGFRYETNRGLLDWDPSLIVPHLNGKLPDGSTDFSLRLLWSANGSLTPLMPFVLPAFKIYNRLATGARTVGLQFVSPSALTFNANMMRMKVSYTDSSGTPRTEMTTAVASSTAVWSNASGYNASKITLTTQYSILTNSEISVSLELTNAPSTGSNANLYVDPEPVLA